MPSFTYTARSRSGEKTEGSVEAGDRHGALAKLEAMGFVPISVTESRAKARAKAKSGKRSWKLKSRGGDKMSSSGVFSFSTELSDLLGSGMTLGNALNTLANRQTGKADDAIIAELRNEIIQGSSLSNALSKQPRSFSPLYVSMIRAGEASGSLSEVLQRLVEHYERLQEIRDKVIMALVYPAIVLMVGLGTIWFVMVYVIPKFETVFAELNATLPLSTRTLMAMSRWVTSYGIILVGGIVVLVVMARRAVKTEAGRLKWHRFLLRVPLLKGVLAAGIYANFARTLGTLMENGVQIIKALAITEQTVTNVVVANEIRTARERVTDGTTISGPLAAGKVFPRMMTDMLAIGEKTGNVPGALNHVARRYERELDRSIRVLTTALEPILIVLIAVLVGFVALSILSAVFSLTSGLEGPV